MNRAEQKRQLFASLAVFVTGIFFFLIMAVTIDLPAVRSLDHWLVSGLDAIRTKPAIGFFAGLTAFGSSRLLIPLIMSCMAYLAVRRQLASAAILPLFFWLERALNEALKDRIQRARPSFEQLVSASGYSFPSGHAMNAAVVYGLLILLVTPTIRTNWVRRLWAATCVMMIVLVAFSRPFLRVHFFTDVFAGLFIGASLVAAAAFVLFAWQLVFVKKSSD